MKKKGSLSLLSLLVSLPVAAQVVEVGDVSGFKEALKNVEAPAVPPSRRVAIPGPVARAFRALCPVLSLDGATVGRGLFENDYTVKIGDQEVGKVSSAGSGWTYTAGGAGQASVALKETSSGREATVTGCNGEALGSVVETASHDSSRFAVADASGKIVAQSGDVEGTSWVMAGPGASATVKNDHWILDRYALSMSGIDGRLVLTAAILNNQALYRRSAERRRENPPHGGRGDR